MEFGTRAQNSGVCSVSQDRWEETLPELLPTWFWNSPSGAALGLSDIGALSHFCQLPGRLFSPFSMGWLCLSLLNTEPLLHPYSGNTLLHVTHWQLWG